jgi:3-methyladenine DNA glycosylase/8-oxoguanine DNA glycosylase
MSPGGAGGGRLERRALVSPRGPYRLPARRGPDGVSRVRGGVWERLLRVEGRLVLVRAWERPRERRVELAAIAVPAAWVRRGECGPPAGIAELDLALERCRHALALDDDLGGFRRAFARDPLLGPPLRRLPGLRPRRCPWPWEALAWAVTEQLIEVERARRIQRRIVRQWGAAVELPGERRLLFDVPGAAELAARAPAELAALDLAPKRALALIRVALEVAAGRCAPGDPDADRRLLRISEIGPWTVQVLAHKGRGDPDSLPAGDLAYVKLVGYLAGLGRRATVAEVEEFYAPYAPYRALAGLFTLVGYGRRMAAAKPLAYHPPRPELDLVA